MPDTYAKTSFWERVFGQPKAYSRFTKDPVYFHEGAANWMGDLGQHSDFPLVGGIDVDVTRADPNETMSHETMHHAFPWYMNKDEQHRLMAPLESEDPRVNDVGMKMLPEEADRSLLERLMRLKALRTRGSQ